MCCTTGLSHLPLRSLRRGRVDQAARGMLATSRATTRRAKMFWNRSGDERAWHTWQRLAPYADVPPPRAGLRGESTTMFGYVRSVYQHGRRGDKAMVDFGGAGVWDTWWEGMRPLSRTWVLVAVHVWLPPGTHSGKPVLWIDAWDEQHPGNLAKRADRHGRRLARDQRRQRSRSR